MTQKRDTENVESRLPEEEDPEVQRWMELLRTDVPPEVEARLNAAFDRFVAQLPEHPTRRTRWLFMPRLSWVNAFVVLVPLVCILSFFLLSPWEDVSRVKILPSTVLLDPDEPGTRKSIELVIKNTGRKPIRETTVHHSCAACSIIAGITEPIAPGETSVVSVPFDYPVHEGKFTERLYVSAYYEGREEPFRSEVAVIGSVQPTISLAPPSITKEVARTAESATASFAVRLLDESLWTNACVADTMIDGLGKSSDVIDVTVETDPSRRLVLGSLRCDASQLGVRGSLSGVITLNLSSSQKDYTVVLPFKLMRQPVRVEPRLLAASANKGATATIELPTGVTFTELIVRPTNLSIAYEKEVKDNGIRGKLVRLVFDVVGGAQATGGLKFGTVTFVFSDGTEISRLILLTDESRQPKDCVARTLTRFEQKKRMFTTDT